MSHLVASVLPQTYICRPTENVNLNQYLTEFLWPGTTEWDHYPRLSNCNVKKNKTKKKEMGDYSILKETEATGPNSVSSLTNSRQRARKLKSSFREFLTRHWF